MKTISILNLKGGVAKTFTAANMAYEIYRRGYRVLLIDNDKQGNLSKAYSRYDAESVAPVTRLLAGDWQGATELIQKDCNVKTGTCQKCDQYINKAEAEKTDEQRYSEEQDAIDRQTKKKLQERADAEKMEHLPNEGNTEHKQHEIKIAASYYEDVVSGKKGFELRKNDRGYKQGDSLKMLEFKDGKHTGRTIDADIIYMLEDYTGLTDGYCILGIRVTDYTGKVSETDTESGVEHE